MGLGACVRWRVCVERWGVEVEGQVEGGFGAVVRVVLRGKGSVDCLTLVFITRVWVFVVVGPRTWGGLFGVLGLFIGFR